MSIQIFIFAFNRPDFLKKQIECFQKNLKNDYTLNVVCDYRDETYLNEFDIICSKKNTNFYKHKSLVGNYSSSYYHGSCLNWTYKNIVLNNCLNDYVVFIDHDMFLLEDFDLLNYMNDCDFSGLLQIRGNVEYVWPGLLVLNMKTISKFNFDFLPQSINGNMLDTGGGTYKLFEKFKFKSYDVVYPDSFEDIDLKDIESDYGFELHLQEKFLHFRNASFWNSEFEVDLDTKKDKILNRVLDFFSK